MKKLIVLIVSAAFFIAVIGGCNKREEFPVSPKPAKTYNGGNSSNSGSSEQVKKQQKVNVDPQKQPPEGPMKKKKKGKKFKLKKSQ